MLNDYLTIDEARKALGYSSRNSIEHLIKNKKLPFSWVCEGKPSRIRLFLKKDVEAIVHMHNT